MSNIFRKKNNTGIIALQKSLNIINNSVSTNTTNISDINTTHYGIAIEKEESERILNDELLQSKIDEKEPLLNLYSGNLIGNFKSYLYKEYNEYDQKNYIHVNTANKFHIHLEGEGIQENEFGLSTGFGARSNPDFGHSVGNVVLTEWFYNCSKFDFEGNSNNVGDGSITFQLFSNGIEQNCYIVIYISDLSINRQINGRFTNSNGNELLSLSDTTSHNHITSTEQWCLKCVSINNLDDVNTRHRLTIQYENIIV